MVLKITHQNETVVKQKKSIDYDVTKGIRFAIYRLKNYFPLPHLQENYA